MNLKISGILKKIAELEHELEIALVTEVEEKQKAFRYRVEKEKVTFEEEIRGIQRKMRKNVLTFLAETPLTSLLVAPIIYSLYIPLVFLDLWLWAYQASCFKAYGIPRVKRSEYVVLDRGGLQYLNWIEQLNCNYCGYANGLMAYAREVASKTEQYFCPIKHARKVLGVHGRYRRFFDFGDAESYQKELERLRNELRKPGS